MQNCLAIDVAKSKSMVTLVSSCGEVLIEPYEINHSINDFSNLLNRINKLKLDNISVIMESTGVYHRPIERFFLEHNFKVFVINPIYGKMILKFITEKTVMKVNIITKLLLLAQLNYYEKF